MNHERHPKRILRRTLIGLGTGVCLLVAFFERPTLQLARFGLSPLPEGLSARVLGLVERLGRGIHSLKSASQTVRVVLLSLVVWAAEVVVYVFIARAFGLDLPTLGLVLVMCVLTLGLVAPSAPGFVGVFQINVIAPDGLGGGEITMRIQVPAFAASNTVSIFME